MIITDLHITPDWDVFSETTPDSNIFSIILYNKITYVL